MRYFVTGTAGFIGFHLARRLLDEGHSVTGFDGMTPYYDVALKHSRNALLQRYDAFRFHIGQLEDMDALRRAADSAMPDVIVHLAAQAGVRYSIDNPRSYTESNLVGSFNVLELARDLKPRHLLLASTSSVYGANEQTPFVETDKTDWPLTFYAATKKAVEAMSHSYSHLFQIPTTSFRFFTVYGPWGRPDMALFMFTRAILSGEPIDVFNHGDMLRDFTYVDDIVEGVIRVSDRVAAPNPAWTGDHPDPATSFAPIRKSIDRSCPASLRFTTSRRQVRNGSTQPRTLYW